MNTRKRLIVGNWKMHLTHTEGAHLASAIVKGWGQTDCVVCPPFTALESVGQVIKGHPSIALGAQNVHAMASGPYTGEIASSMLCALGVQYVIIGHSERRTMCGETDAVVQAKVKAALEAGLKPIICVGETLVQRDDGQTLSVIQAQVEAALSAVGSKIEAVTLAYEPIWAIGTGKAATAAQAQEVHAHMRAIVGRYFNETAAQKLRILYGGSVNAQNAESLFAESDIDGGLVGGVSLQAETFIQLGR